MDTKALPWLPDRKALPSGLLGLVLFCSTGAVHAADHFVSVAGSDPGNDCLSRTAPCRFVSVAGSDPGNDCLSRTAPCRTIGHAFTQALSGDLIKVAAGRYRENLPTIDSSVTLTVCGGWSADFLRRDHVALRTILHGGNLARVVEFAAGTGEVIVVMVDGVTITRGRNANAVGGAARAASSGDGRIVLSLSNCTIAGNRAVSGGGVWAESSDGGHIEVAVSNCTFKSNRAVGAGGAIGVKSSGNGEVVLSLVHSTLTRNRARDLDGGEGGAIWAYALESGSLEVRLTTGVLINNRTRDNGGGILAVSEQSGALTIDLTNCTLTANRTGAFGDGGGLNVISLAPSAKTEATLKNSILWNNRAEVGGDLAMFGDAVTVHATHNDIGDRITLSGHFVDDGGNIDTDPRLVRPRRDVHLVADSPCIDAGTCTDPPLPDIDGDPRPVGTDCDIGADEFVP
jgi:hypothetical protein